MNNWYTTERIAQERHADFQRETDVVTLLTSLEDVADPSPGLIDRLVRSIQRVRTRLIVGSRHGGLSGAGRHG